MPMSRAACRFRVEAASAFRMVSHSAHSTLRRSSSEGGAGSTFHFTARLGLAARREEAESPGAASLLSVAGPLRFLIVEDNAVNRMLAATFLEKEGHRTVGVADGNEALAMLAEETFDCVLMDVQMPVMDGYEATRLIREISPDLPVIGQTAHVLQDAIEQCHEAGMVAHVSKPIDRHDLVTMILRHARPRPQG